MLSRKTLVALVALALTARLAHLLFLWSSGTGFLIEDSSLYLDIARWMRESGVLLAGSSDGLAPPVTDRMYGYVLFLSVVGWLAGGVPTIAVVCIQAAADCVTVLCVACAAARLGPRVGTAAGILAAIWPNLILHSGLILTDTLSVALMSVAMLSFILFAEKPTWARALAIGGAFGASLAVRHGLLPLAPLIAALMVWIVVRHENGKDRIVRAFGVAMVMLMLVAVFLAPQIVRHWDRAGGVAFTTQSGPHFLYWVAAESASELNGGSRADWASNYDERINRRIAEQSTPPNPFEISSMRTNLAFELLSQMPTIGLVKIWVRSGIVNLFAPSLAFHPWTRAQKQDSFDAAAQGNGLVSTAISFVSNQPARYTAVVLPAMVAAAATAMLAAVGLFACFRHFPGFTAISVGYVAYVLVLTGPVIGAKYALPADPVLIVWTAMGLCVLGGLIHRRLGSAAA